MLKRWNVYSVLLVVGVLVAAIAISQRDKHAVAKVPALDDAQRIASGQPIYERHCASCHGAKLEGQPNWTSKLPSGRLPAPPHDESGHTWHHPSAMLFAITKHGLKPPHAPAGYQSDMPAFVGKLNDDEVWDVIAFIRSRWPERVRERHSQLDMQYQKQEHR